jgi:hypothetical protein
MKVDGQCPICRDFYDDAVLARDGFAYCRECILQWAGHGERNWRSPRTNEVLEGHPVLRSDVERNCAAKELRKQELLESMNEDAEVLQALAASHCDVPLLEKSDCEKLLWHPVILTSPYVHLAIAHRASALSDLPSNVVQEVCRLDRCAVTVPLLEMEVVVALLREAVRRCGDARVGEEEVEFLKYVKAHVLWRGKARDAVEVPIERTHERKLAGFYHRAWRSIDAKSAIFVKGNGIRETRYHMVLPLLSDLSRGSCETPLKTCIYAEPTFPTTSEDDCAPHAAYSSETLVRRDGCHWRARRGGLSFPDSRGDQDSEDEDWTEKVTEGCCCIFEKIVRHVPQGFVYHRYREEEDHWFELMAEVNLANEALLSACACCGSSSGVDGEDHRLGKRRRLHE